MKFSYCAISTLLCISICCSIVSSQQTLRDNVKQLAQINDDQHLNQTLSKISKPRIVGSRNHDEIANFIKNELNAMGFTVELDQFTSEVPIFKRLTFTNIVGKLNPDAEKYLVLACHYDSKYFKNIPNFVGAIDSAVPCAINLNIAKVLLPQLQILKDKTDISLMLIFFDGEEAIEDWNEVDSVYGSRHLAQKMTNQLTRSKETNQDIRYIDKIEVLILLDLIGAKNSKFYNFYPNTQVLHSGLVNIERLLDNEGLLEESRRYQFMPRNSNSFVDDDHRPFLERNVPILHLITTPFPKQWHKSSDTVKNLHWPAINNFNKVLRIFVYEYLTKHTDKFNFRSQ